MVDSGVGLRVGVLGGVDHNRSNRPTRTLS